MSNDKESAEDKKERVAAQIVAAGEGWVTLVEAMKKVGFKPEECTKGARYQRVRRLALKIKKANATTVLIPATTVPATIAVSKSVGSAVSALKDPPSTASTALKDPPSLSAALPSTTGRKSGVDGIQRNLDSLNSDKPKPNKKRKTCGRMP
jgi:hypothetical protein